MTDTRESTESPVRRLAAIFCADVAGFSRLMGEDEEGTLAALKAHRVAVDPLVYSHGGRIVGTAGDGILFEFPSVTEAVRCAFEVQSLMAGRNATVPAGRRMAFRIGINLGEVMVAEDGEIFGDEVNIAARIQATAEPGGVSVSESVHHSVDGRIEASFTDAGDHELKNIAQPVRIWRLELTTSAPGDFGLDLKPTVGPTALVVLPFERLGPNEDDDYLVDGITEDVTTALTDYGEFRVVPRSSAFAYRDTALGDRDIAREVDATNVLRGSVRVSGGRVRISVQLIDAEAGHVMWAERFDRDLEDVFELQDEIARSITNRIAPEVRKKEVARSREEDAGSVESWDLFNRGRWHYYRMTREDFTASIELLLRAVEADPSNVQACSWLPFVIISRIWRGWSPDVKKDFELAREMAVEAVRLDDSSWRAHAGLALYYSFHGDHERGISEAEKALPWSPGMMGVALWLAGDHKGAIEHLTEAMQASPHQLDGYHWMTTLAYAHYMDGNYPAALAWGEQALEHSSRYVQVIAVMAAALAQLGRQREASEYMAEFIEHFPAITAETYRTRFSFKNESDLDHYMEGLVKAGMPG